MGRDKAGPHCLDLSESMPSAASFRIRYHCIPDSLRQGADAALPRGRAWLGAQEQIVVRTLARWCRFDVPGPPPALPSRPDGGS
jgi:hypothetical protein